MKRLKFPVFFAAMAMALVTAFAFNTPQKATTFTTSYHYIGAFTDAEVKKPINWVAESVTCDAEGDLPCSIATELDRTNFDMQVQAFTNVADATSAATTKTYQ